MRKSRLAYVFIFGLARTSGALAYELPNELVLQCEGKSTVIGKIHNPINETNTFNMNIQLLNGSLFNITKNHLMAEGCLFDGNEIICKLDETKQSTGSTQRREAFVFLNRASGTLRSLLTIRYFDGVKQTGILQIEDIGTCRAAKPIF